ncbi:6-carboxytetrahydropterin synthase [Ktedonosporobacter rubrisoli]|uniref:6-carboxy-5,6,7,8-tetrahydropterin synthase n=1 Tax=Ktedonosporobacter rubrisoli TaxID=2509675 RepID=A0A4P6K5D4_KTERU|nr:6-carboxytetrahydropterin synthase [Ktedonosporobacter rubrisoli]QBD83163.1 6-carboxytetrahydropterin synthase [Ktedonosporobacter rubrisoli]
MPRYAIITRLFPFEACHHLPGHQGKCRRPHGHSYQLEVSLRGPIKETQGLSDEGMVLDFAELKALVNRTILEQLDPRVPRGPEAGMIEQGGMDHNDLNVLTGIRTTAENLVHWIWEALVAGGVPEEFLYRIRLWETEKGYVEITQAERGQEGR